MPPPTVVELKSVDGQELDKRTAFLVRVVRLWSIAKKGDAECLRLLHMVLKDAMGERIQATIEESLINNFKEDLVEHGLYFMKNFRVAVNNEPFKPTVHPWKFFFLENTKLHPEELQAYTGHLLTIYNFKSVDECLQVPQSCINNLIDFIGAYDPEEGYTTGQNKKGTNDFISIHLRDASNKRIKCSLWDSYGVQARGKLEACTGKKFAVVILQLVRVVRWEQTSLATSYDVSKVIIDKHIPEIEDFRQRYCALLGDASEGSSKTSLSGEVKTIHQLQKICKNVKGFYFYGKISRILSEDGWYYKGCPDPACAKKVDTRGDEFVCRRCTNKVTQPVARYRIKYEVDDGNSKTFVVFWDEVTQHLLGKAVVDFVNAMDKGDGEHSAPKEIMDFVGRSFLFKTVGFSENDAGARSYHVNALEDDPEIVALHMPKPLNIESDDSDDDLTLLSRSTTEISSKEKAVVDDGEVMTPSSKRALDRDGVGEDDAPTTQGSTNKKMKGVKIEKD